MKLKALQVLDSRGIPTVQVDINGYKAIAPSGKSTGAFEAKELRDHKKNYYFGKSVNNSIKALNTLRTKLYKAKSQKAFDYILKEKIAKIGSNSAIAASMSYARYKSKNKLIPYLNKLTKTKKSKPIIFANIINGGQHANNNLKFQEFIISPNKIKKPEEQVRAIAEIYHQLQKEAKTYCIGDEGGLSIKNIDEVAALDLIEQTIQKSSYKLKDIRIALDVAASEFFQDEFYYINNKKLTAAELMDFYKKIIKHYKIYSIEDPFDQLDYAAWKGFMKKSKALVVGDDLTVSNITHLKNAIQNKLCNAMILKPNQVGTITDSIDAIKLATKHKITLIASHRSGDTEDPFIVDFALAMGAKHMKIGAPCRGERTSKYNRFLEISR